MLGVPTFIWCDTGVSSRTAARPCSARSLRMTHGPSRKLMTNAVTMAYAERNVM